MLVQGRWTALLGDPGSTPPAGARGLCPGADQYIAAVDHFGRAMALAARGAAAAAAGDLREISRSYLAGAAAELAGLQVCAAEHPALSSMLLVISRPEDGWLHWSWAACSRMLSGGGGGLHQHLPRRAGVGSSHACRPACYLNLEELGVFDSH